MIRAKVFLPEAMVSWSEEELEQLEALARSGASIEDIASALHRSAPAVRNKAGLHGISLIRSRPPAPAFVTEADFPGRPLGAEHRRTSSRCSS